MSTPDGIYPYSQINIVSKGNLSLNTMWGGPYTDSIFTNTCYYWNNHLTTNTPNTGNPLVFSYNYNSASSTTAYLYVMCDNYAQFYLNNTYIQTFSGYEISNQYIPVQLIPGNNLFSFTCVYVGNVKTLYTTPMFSCVLTSGTANNSPVLFTTTDPDVGPTGWSLAVSGYFTNIQGNTVGFTDLFAPNTISYDLVWNQCASPTNVFIYCSAMSGSGQYVFLGSDKSMYYSKNYGVSWSQSTISPLPNNRFNSMVTSKSGQYVLVTENAKGNIYYSNNYGVNWYLTNAPILSWFNVSISTTGQYALASGSLTDPIRNIYYSSNYGIDWVVKITTFNTWKNVQISGSGNYGIGDASGNIYYSNDFVNWNKSNLLQNPYLVGLALSSSGQYCVTCENNRIYNSFDYGKTWTQTTLSTMYFFYNPIVSATGQYQIVCSSGIHMFRSNDYGVTWKITIDFGLGPDIYPFIGMSDSGQYLSFAAMNYTTGANIYYANYSLDNNNNLCNVDNSLMNYNVFDLYNIKTFSSVNTQQTNYNLPIQGVYTPQSTWTQATVYNGYPSYSIVTDVSWQSIATSSSGQYVYACYGDGGGNIHCSSDYGKVFKQSSSKIFNSWTAITTSSSGQYVYACASSYLSSGYVYYSNNYGQNWVQSTTPNIAFYTVATSSSGQYVYTSSAFQLYYSNNYGITFTLATLPNYTSNGFNSINGVTTSSSGQYVYSAVLTGNIYYSYDYAKNWTQATTTPRNYYTISTSSSGQYVYAGVNNLNVFYSYDYGRTWTQSTTSPSSIDIRTSSSGRYVYTCVPNGIYISYSNDYGKSWTQTTSNLKIRGITVSSSGKYVYIAAKGGNIWYGTLSTSSSQITDLSGSFDTFSRDLSLNYNLQTLILPVPGAPVTWNYVAMSSIGQYRIASQYSFGNIYYSNNYGQNWVQSTTPVQSINWTSLSLSSSGKYGLASVASGSANGFIYYSNNYGINWTKSPTQPATTQLWYSVSISSSGQYGLGCVNSGNIYYSNDYGLTWFLSNNTSGLTWQIVSISASGQYGFAAVYNGNIYYSTNRGINWTKSTSPSLKWYSVSISSSGQYGLACVYDDANNGIYYTNDYGQSWKKSPDQPALPQYWISVSISSSGQYGLAVINASPGGYTYYSNNYGLSWTLSSSTPLAYRCAISSTGDYGLACSSTGSLYNLQLKDYPLPNNGLVFIKYNGYYGSTYENVLFDFSGNGGIRYFGSGITNFVNLTTATNGNMIPNGPTDNYFTIVWNGYFVPNYTGLWKFSLASDDGSYMWLNKTTTYTTTNADINNGGLRPFSGTSSAQISLTSGQYYPIRILYGQYDGGYDICFNWSINNGTTYISDFTGLLYSYPYNISISYGLVFIRYNGYYGYVPYTAGTYENVIFDSSGNGGVKYSGSGITNFGNLTTATNGLTISNTTGTGFVDTNFTIVWNGYFVPNYTGLWKFSLGSDDGSYMWLNKTGYTTTNADISNGNPHAMLAITSAQISLTSGQYYPIRILYGQALSAYDICFNWSINNGTTYSSDFTGLLYSYVQ